MSRKLTHGLIITVILIAVFFAAALTPAKADTASSKGSVAVNLAKVDFESRTLGTEGRMIADNDIPLASVPFETDSSSMAMIVVAIAALVTGIVIIEECTDRRTRQV